MTKVSVQQTQIPTFVLATYTKEVTRPAPGLSERKVFRTEVQHGNKTRH